MFNSFWAFRGIIIVVSIVADAVVKVVKSSRSGAGSNSSSHKALIARIDDLEADVTDLEQDLEDARERIVVLEKIVTDGKYNLGKEIDDLASGAD